MSDDEVNIIKPPDTLRAKVKKGGPDAVDVAALDRAEDVIASMADNYLEWVEEDLGKIQAAYETLQDNLDNQADHKEKIFQIAHDMKGQGGSFGYDLITILGNDLCRFIETHESDLSPVDQKVIKLYIDTMRIVITKRMSGDGGKEGKQVLMGLAAVVEKLSKS